MLRMPGAAALVLTVSSIATAQTERTALIDRHALLAPAQVEHKVDHLVAYLVRPAHNDYEKVRAIFRWMTDRVSYDVAAFMQGHYGDLRPEAVLQRRSGVCSGYTSLFEAMCRRAGIEVATVNGCAKGFGYQAGHPNHAWNAVQLQGHWHLLDVTWAAGHINPLRTFVKHFKEHFFLTPPEQMILTHFPTEPRWQLLQRPLTLEQFSSLPSVDAELFEMGVSSNAIWQTMQSRSFQGFVKTYAHDGPLRLVTAPIDSSLQAGKEYVFVVEAPYAVQMSLVNNGQFVPMQRRGRCFQGVVRPQGDVKLAQQRNPADPLYQVILHYGVQ